MNRCLNLHLTFLLAKRLACAASRRFWLPPQNRAGSRFQCPLPKSWRLPRHILTLRAPSFCLPLLLAMVPLGHAVLSLIRFVLNKALPTLAALVLCWTATPALGRPETVLSSDGWTIEQDAGRGRLTIKHQDLGTILRDIRLNVDTGGSIRELNQWKAEANGPSRLLLRTSGPRTTWSFEAAGDHFIISDTAPGAVLTGPAPVSNTRRLVRLLDTQGTPVTWQGTGEVEGTYGGSRTRNPSFLPGNNPECTVFYLGPNGRVGLSQPLRPGH